jgi:hypothetical protein
MRRTFLTILTLLLCITLAQAQLRYTTIWEKSQATGTLPTFIGTGNTERGLDYGVVEGTERLFLVSRLGTPRVLVLNPANGDSVGFLDATGITGGTFTLNDVEVSADGKIYACNLTINSQLTAFKVYRWDNLASTPVVVIEYTTSTAYRLGDRFTIVGSTADNSITIWAGAASQDKVFRFNTTDNGATFTATEITLSDGVQGTVPSISPKGTGAVGFYLNSAGRNVKEYDANGNLIATLPGSVVATGSTALEYIKFGLKEYLVVFNYGGGNENFSYVDITEGLTNGVLVFRTAPLGTNQNLNGTGDISVKNNGDGTFDLFVLGTNNGIARYRTKLYSNVTFNVNMKVKTAKGLFNPAEDSLVVRGTFNNWSGNADLLTDPDGDTVYTITKNYLPAGETTEFKFVILKDNQDIWESISNRSLVFPEGTASYNFYFDNDSVITAQAQVTFNVNMRVKILKGEFTPSSDLLVIRGNFNGWSGLADQLSDTDGDSIYSITKTFNVGDNLEFKFVIHRSGTDFWEDRIPNRTYTVQPGTNIYNGGYFNNDSIYVPRVPIQFTFSCNMELERLSGRFNPATDTVSVNGTFNGWASKQWILQPNALNPDLYEGTWTINAGVGESIEFKFWYTPNNWESRPNRVYTFTQDDINAGSVFYSGAFNDASLATVLNQPATIKFTVYTQGAVSVVNGQPFPVVNTVHIAGSALPLQWPSGGWPNSDSVRMIRLYDDGTNGDLVAGDKIFSRDITFPQYTVLRVEYKYSINFGDAVNNGGGNDNEAGFAQNHILNMTRFMTGATTVDTFGRMGDSYLTNITGVNDQVVTKPTTYSLSQNYPNPFNPTTTINFALPKESNVTLKVYNMIGQEVMTLISNERMNSGYHSVKVDGSKLTSGVYIYKLTAGDFVATKKMVLLK